MDMRQKFTFLQASDEQIQEKWSDIGTILRISINGSKQSPGLNPTQHLWKELKMSFYWRGICRGNRRIPPYLEDRRMELQLKLPQQSTEWQVGRLMSVQQFSFYSFTRTKIMCQSLDSWRKIEDKHTQGSQIQTSALNRNHIKWIICHITQFNFNWE